MEDSELRMATMSRQRPATDHQLSADADVILLYGPTWDGASQMSKHHLARYWSRSRQVLYVESPPNPLSFVTRPEETRRLLHRYFNGPIQVDERLWVHSYFYPLPYRGRALPLGARWVNEFNQWVVLPQLRRLLAHLGLEGPIVFVGSAQALPLLNHLSPQLVIYHCSDDYIQQDNFPSSFAGLERDLMRCCDLVITTAEELRRAKAHLHDNVHTVTNGADVAHFALTQSSETKVASDLRGLPRPIVGYIGSIFQWIDQEMVAYAARACPNWSFVFIGPLDTDVSRLRSLSNIHLLGPRPYADLPSYLKGFDVATVPFVLHDVTLRASPIKFYEYLASGVPIVATRLPDFEPFTHLVGLVTTPEEFVTVLEDTITQDTSTKRQARMAEAQDHSWEARFTQIDHLIGEALERKRAEE